MRAWKFSGLTGTAAALLMLVAVAPTQAALIYSADPPGNGTPVSGPDPAGSPATQYAFGGNSTWAIDTGLAVPQSFTMSAWVNLSDNSGDNMVFGTNSGAPMHLGFRNSDAYFGFWGNDSSAPGAGATALNQWQHFIWTYDASTGNQDIYENGVLISSSGGHPPYQNGGTITIAGNSGNGGGLDGALDDVRIYDTPVTALPGGAAALYQDSARPDTVPEPTSLALVVIGGVGFYLRRRSQA